MARISKSDREEAIARLRELLKPGDVVYTIVRHVSRSGMSRVIDAYVFLIEETNGKPYPRWIGTYVARALGYRYDDNHNGIVVGGCGMDMAFHVVHHLGRVLFPDGFVPVEAGLQGRNRTPDTERDHDGGYALQKRAL